MYSKMQGRMFWGGAKRIDSMPSSEMTTISPFSTSRTKRAPMMSSAQVSDARMARPSNSPRTSGRMPVAEDGSAGCRIAHVADGREALEPLDGGAVGKTVADEAELLLRMKDA